MGDEMPKKKIDEVLDAVLDGVSTAEELFARDGVFKQLQKRALERLLDLEMTEHLGYEKHAAEGFNKKNSRNGRTTKTVRTGEGAVSVSVPRDRDGSFEPQIVGKGVRRLKGFDDKVIALYSRGLTVRDVQAHLAEIYDVNVSADLISRITDQVLDDVREWRERQLDRCYPILYLDGMVLKVRDEGRVVRNQTVYIALAINMRGQKEVLGLWMSPNEGAKFWLSVLAELKTRGLEDVFIACCDGLSGFPQAIEATFPHALVQTCIVHQIRASTRIVAWKNRKAVARSLRPIYTAVTEEGALKALELFESEWGKSYPSIGRSWRTNWETIRPFYGFPEEIRRVIYTTNAIESLNRQLRKVTKTRGSFPTETSALKLLWLALEKIRQKWTYPVKNWSRVLQQLYILFPDRIRLEEATE